MRIAMLQMNPVVGDLVANCDALMDGYEQAVRLGADCVVSPELALSGYPPEDLLLKDGFIADIRDYLHNMAVQVGNVPFFVGAPMEAGAEVVVAPPSDARRVSQVAAPTRSTALGNCVAVLRDGRIEDVAVKRLLPNYDVFDEQRYFQPGMGDPTVVSVGSDRVAIVVCEDAWMSDGPLSHVGDVEVVVVANASPYARGRQSEREAMAAQRARETNAFFVSVNTVGGQDELVFDGQSFALNPRGELIARAGTHVEQILLVDTATEQNAIADPLDPLAEIYHALVAGTRDYIHKNGFRSVVIAISGGVDSALVAAIATDALGPDCVRGFALPSRYSSDHSRSDAADLARRLGVTLEEIPIEVAHVALSSSLALALGGEPSGLTDENLQSRIRGVIMMGISNATGAVVLTTGNKSEIAVGYSTLYGDSVGGFAVIKDVPKTLVYDLCRWRNAEARHAGGDDLIPPSILTKAPSAELRPDQRDDQSLPPYDVLDPILALYVEHDATAAQIVAAGYDAALVARITSLVDAAEYKRRQSPPGVRITSKAFGKDRRMPITNRYRGLEGS